MISASKSALLLSPCLLWASPGAREYDDSLSDHTKRDKGSLFHGAMDLYYQHGMTPAAELQSNGHCGVDEEVLGWVHRAQDWSQEELEDRCEHIYSEVYVARNFSTKEVHWDYDVRDRGYPDKPGFLPGTADLACILFTGELYVADWKTGGSAGAEKQLLTLASGLRHVYRKDDGSLRDVRLAVLHAGPDGVLSNEWAVTDADLQAHADAMAFQLADVGVRNDPVPGAHCTQLYCPHLAHCPAIADTVRTLAAEERLNGHGL